MTTDTAAEMLYDEYTGTTGRFHTSTQKDRWLTFTAKVIAAAQPAPARVIDRDAIARAAWTSYDGEQSWDELCALAEQKPDGDYADIRDGYLGEADRILTILPGRTVAQVKAEAWDEGLDAAAEAIFGPKGAPRPGVPQITWVLPENPYRADELEREDGRG